MDNGKEKTDMESLRSKDCSVHQQEECGYTAYNQAECTFDKKHCIHPRHKPWHCVTKDFWKYFCFVLIGLGLFVTSTYVENYYQTFLQGIALSLIAGVVVARVVDLGAHLSTYKTAFVDTLISDNYLKEMDSRRLTTLRERITEQLHKKDVPKMAKGLIKLDEEFCRLLQSPYYTVYRQNVICEKRDLSQDYYWKTVTIYYQLENPRLGKKEATIDLSISNSVFLETDCLVIEKFSISHDDNSEDLKETIKISHTPLDDSTRYTHKLKMNIGEDTDGIIRTFNDTLTADIVYKIKIHKDDITFTKRLKHPVKNFILSYVTKDENVSLHAQVLGTLIEEKNIRTEHREDNNINIETLEWLLPQNGVFVVMTQKDIK